MIVSMRRKWLWGPVLFATVASRYAVEALTLTRNGLDKQHRVVVVGKVIIDEYGKEDSSDGTISVGGGGPQASFGAAAALALLRGDSEDPPQPQLVTFLGPVGKLDWTTREDQALHNMLDPMVDSIHLIEGPSLRTPRIQLWHDEDQRVQWRPLNDSFGPEGAGKLWQNRPSAEDVLQSLDDEEIINSLHVILEVEAESPGDGADSNLLSENALLQRSNVVGVEPIAFPDSLTGEVPPRDVDSCSLRLNKISAALDFVSPDDYLYRALDADYWNKWDVAVRKGPEGSVLFGRRSQDVTTIPAAKLVTPDGKPVNPTGAGNAYAAAMSTCLGAGASLMESGCIATAIGAAVCEYEHLPPWDANVLNRIRQAADEVRKRLAGNEEIST